MSGVDPRKTGTADDPDGGATLSFSFPPADMRAIIQVAPIRIERR